jgi:hypothetical protein
MNMGHVLRDGWKRAALDHWLEANATASSCGSIMGGTPMPRSAQGKTRGF